MPKSEIKKYLNPKRAPTPYVSTKSRRIGLTSTLVSYSNISIEVIVASAKFSRIRIANTVAKLNFKSKVFIEPVV